MAEINFPEEASEGFKYLSKTVAGDLRHENYTRVVELKKLYSQLISGKDVNELLHRFIRREDENLFEQRKRMTQAITPSVSASIMNPFYKVGRVETVAKSIQIEDKEKKEIILKAVREYNGEKSVERYLEQRFVDISFTDPNAFIVTEFDEVEVGPQGEMVGELKPRPFEVSSEEAINFKYENGILEWLIVKLPCDYKNKDGSKTKSSSYTIYLSNVAIKFTPVDFKDYETAIEGSITTFNVIEDDAVKEIKVFKISNDKIYIVEYFEHKTGKVQAFRIGYKMDLITDGKTFVNPMHQAVPYFLKSIKAVSEFDLTIALHAFPQKFQYVPRCTAEDCSSGITAEGANCSVCKGTGMLPIHTTAQDALLLRLPKNKDEIFDFAQLVHYERPPIDILDFQNKYIIQLKNDARQSVFNSEIFSKTEVAATATEMNISMNSVYDTLFPFAEQFSYAYKYIVSIIGSLFDEKNIVVEHRFPKDFKFKTVSDLLAEQKLAVDSQAPSYIRNEISADIAKQLFVDKPEELKRVIVKQQFFPFPDKSQNDIMFIISNGLTTEYDKLLWSNFDNIFFKIEKDLKADGLNLYDLPSEKIQELIDKKVSEIKSSIEEGKPQGSINFSDTVTQ